MEDNIRWAQIRELVSRLEALGVKVEQCNIESSLVHRENLTDAERTTVGYLNRLEVSFVKDLRALLRRYSEEFSVPTSILVGLLVGETHFITRVEMRQINERVARSNNAGTEEQTD